MSAELGTTADLGSAPAEAPASGQPVQETNGQASEGRPFDQISAQADYTRKTEEVAKQRQALEEQRQQLEQERQAFLQHVQSGYQQPYQAPTQQNWQQTQQTYVQPYQQPYQAPLDQGQALQQHLAEQFGSEGARVIDAYLKTQTSALQRQYYVDRYQSEYNKFLEQGKQKFGESFDKFNYKDPLGRPAGNRVVDLLAKAPELSIEQAYAALAGADLQKQEQMIREKIYAEQQRKTESVPAQKVAQPRATGTGHANSVREAFEQAEAQLGKRID